MRFAHTAVLLDPPDSQEFAGASPMGGGIRRKNDGESPLIQDDDIPHHEEYRIRRNLENAQL